MSVYKARYYPLGIRGGKWVELWNMGVERRKMIVEMAHEELNARVEKLWGKL